ncbi:MAG: hypothetical protein OEX81_02100 [Candidatus Pacebacteria bacterium]|nr:hypothetical protein [Candidatus Paceibacterota bacterium]
MAQRGNEGLTAYQLAHMSREELTAEWMKARKELEAKDPNTLTDTEKNYLIMAIFYTTQQE